MKAWVWIWTPVSLMFAFFSIVELTRDWQYSGNTIVMAPEDRDILAISVDSTIEAASEHFFVLRSAEGEVIYGSSTEKPLGWGVSEYFTLDSTSIKGGVWVVEAGQGITIKLSSAETISVRASQKPSVLSSNLFRGLSYGFIAWIIGLGLGMLVWIKLPNPKTQQKIST